MSPAQTFRQHLPKLLLPAVWVLLACSSFGPDTLSQSDILATADAIRTRTPVANTLDDHERKATPNSVERTRSAERIFRIADEVATQRAKDAEQEATEEAEFYATVEAIDATGEAGYATYEAEMTEEAQWQDDSVGCVGGCTTYPNWCEPPIKGNVSFDSGERIYHMQGDEYYDETRINPDYGEYYFCTPEEAEAAGFRRAYN